MPMMVKGAGYRSVGGVKPLEGEIVYERAAEATIALRGSISKSYKDNGADVRKSLNPDFANQFGMFLQSAPGASNQLQPMVDAIQQVAAAVGQPDVLKNFLLTSPLASGLVPFDLEAPSKLIYPVFSPIRNKIPRVQGQGTSRRTKVITGIQGSQTGSGNGPARWSIAETNPASAYPGTLPAAGHQSAVDVNIPYKFFGLSESLSWLSQFSGQGFEDIAALANLVLMQEAMLAEEYTMLWGTGTAIVAPAAPTVAIRTAGSNETAIAAAGGGNSYYIRVTAINIYGETTMSAAAEAALGATTGKVLDVTITPSLGASQYNVYISAAAAAGSAPAGRTSYFRQASSVGGARYTIQGTLAGSGTNPPAADSTAGANDYEGLFSVLSGHAVTDAAVYPAGFLAGYYNASEATTLSIATIAAALQLMWNGPGAFRADPAEIICEAGDAKRLNDDILTNNGSGVAYKLQIQQSEVAGLIAGSAVSQFVNPVTRSLVNILVHPWFHQGNAMLMSYQLPIPNSNISNIWEAVNVQDYLSVGWPVIDPTFRYSLFLYGTLVGHAPQYCGLIQGLQVSAATPYS